MQRAQQYVNDELHEVFVITLPHTIIYPGAVVIHLENTLVALGAVMCSLGLPPHAALLATVQSSCVDIVRHLDICRNVARICECASQVRKYRHQTQAIENYELKQTVKR